MRISGTIQTEHNSILFCYSKNILGVFRPWFAEDEIRLFFLPINE